MSARQSLEEPSRLSPASLRLLHDENLFEIKKENLTTRPTGDADSRENPVVALVTSKLANNAAPKKSKASHEHSPPASAVNSPVDLLMARLSQQQAILNSQNEALKMVDDETIYTRVPDLTSSSSSVPVTPATDTHSNTHPSTRPASAHVDQDTDSEELIRLKLELAEVQAKITHLEQSSQPQSRTDSVKLDDTDYPQPIAPVAVGRGASWIQNEPHCSVDDGMVGPIDRVPSGGMAFPSKPGFLGTGSAANESESANGGNWYGQRQGLNPGLIDLNSSYSMADGYRSDRLTPDPDMLSRSTGGRRGNRYDRYPTPASLNAYGVGYQGNGQFDHMTGHHVDNGVGPGPHGMAMNMYGGYASQQLGTSLSPHASEFTSTAGWKPEGTESQTYLPPTEPLNYRRLLDRNVNCNWKYIVDKIVCNNDQQASIFLQQKLKVGTPEQKYEIVEAIVAQAYPLMVNRFGNFLVQRCFEHGTPEQVIKIAEAIRGNTLSLSMDPFGCHVVQKAFDSVPENYKAIMVHELLRRIPETVIHRYACHVWQKLFELRWTETPPQIMKFVNEALRGMWHEVALGETGSLVVQNIFENCLEEDKRPCIEEVLANIDIVAHGQFGNWCIQHICEHGAPADRSRAIDHVIRYAAKYSTDQFASKVVEKCLKIGGNEFLSRYLDRVTEGRVDRPRIPLIDIASDQYGNYLIQWVLTHASPQFRDVVAAHIRKHMVSLRGSKFGSRVGMLCTNPASATRPGPAMGPGMSGRMHPGSRYGGPSYR